ncbi:MAG: 2OG-Fe(II) oxygenase [Kofleriaceae bacterium]|nr:2OG-Fe(II) oxygenase [Kofleriaceae bacterium]
MARDLIQLGASWSDEAALARTWREARPFPHLVVDDFIAPAALPALLEILEEEGVDRYEADLYAFDATAPEPRTPEMRELRAVWADVLAPVLTRVTGKPVTRADLRAYAYRVGHYLLPHADHQEHLERRLAFAYYLPSPEPPEGGELELYACTLTNGELVEITSAALIAPRDNRLVVFDVSDVSLHQVREVLAGLRLSLSGWFYP